MSTPEAINSGNNTEMSNDEYDLEKLADATTKSLRVLWPWRTSTSLDTTANQALAILVQRYHNAITDSVVSAQVCHTVAEEIIDYLKIAFKTEYSQEQRVAYLQGTVELSKKGKTKAAEAEQTFRDMRTQLVKAITAAKQEEPGTAVGDLDQFERDIPVLEEFVTLIAPFVIWWSATVMEQQSFTSRIEQNVIEPNAIRNEALIIRCTTLRERYKAYTSKINDLRDLDDSYWETLEQKIKEAKKDKVTESAIIETKKEVNAINPAPSGSQHVTKKEDNQSSAHDVQSPCCSCCSCCSCCIIF